jgi:hypothetical protein
MLQTRVEVKRCERRNRLIVRIWKRWSRWWNLHQHINQNNRRPLIQQKNEPELLPGQYQMLIRVLPSAHALARSEVAGYWLLDLPAQHRGGRLLTRIAIAIGVFE